MARPGVVELEKRCFELERQNAEIGQQIVDQGAKLNAVTKDLGATRYALAEAEKQRDAAVNDNRSLRDELATMTVDKGRLEGSIEVYREFAPVPERDAYLDRIPRHERRAGNGGYVSQGEPRGYEFDTAGASRPGWYRRF